MKKLIYLFALSLVLAACGDHEDVIYSSDAGSSQSLARFTSGGSNLEVEINSSNSIDVGITVSTLSSSARTVTVSVDEEKTTATPGMYSFSPTATIPANSFTGVLTVTGMDDGLTTEGATLELKLDSVDGGVAESRHAIQLFEICPIDATFATGMYTLGFVSGGIGAAGNAPALGDGIAVELLVGSSSTERIFNVKCYPSFGFANPPADFSFSLVCGTTVSNGIVEGQASGVGCGGSIAFGAAATAGVYTVGDDQMMTLTFTEDTEEICGASGTTSYTLTKI